MARPFVSQSLANALGTLIALAVAYLVGVLAGVFTSHLLTVGLASLLLSGVVLFVLGLGLLGGSGWAGAGFVKRKPSSREER